MSVRGTVTPWRLANACLALALVFVGLHFVFAAVIGRLGMALGAVAPELAPLYAYWNPHFKLGLIVPVICSATYVWLLRRNAIARDWSDTRAILFFITAFLAMALTVPLIDGGPGVWIGPFVSRVDVEYYGALDRVGDVRTFLRDYVKESASYPMHTRTHPPGAILLLAGLTRLLGGGPWAAALGVIGFTTLTVPLVFALARAIGGPELARRACALFVVTPNVVLFTATSMDGPFMVVLVAALWAFWVALGRESMPWGLLAGLLAAAGSLLTYSTALVLLFCGLAWLASLFDQMGRRGVTVGVGLSAALAFLAAHLALWLLTGFSSLAMLQTAIAQDHAIMAGTRHDSLLRHAALAAGNLSAFGFSVGLPTLALWLDGVSDTLSRNRCRTSSGPFITRFTLCGAGTLLIAAALPVYSLEVERIWIFLTPIVIVPASATLVAGDDSTTNLTTLSTVRLLAAQTILTELLLCTYW